MGLGRRRRRPWSAIAGIPTHLCLDQDDSAPLVKRGSRSTEALQVQRIVRDLFVSRTCSDCSSADSAPIVEDLLGARSGSTTL